MSDTPRTDAKVLDYHGMVMEENGCVPADFARQLERELANLEDWWVALDFYTVGSARCFCGATVRDIPAVTSGSQRFLFRLPKAKALRMAQEWLTNVVLDKSQPT